MIGACSGCEQALPAVGESLPDWQIMSVTLAKRMEAQLGAEPSAGFEYQDAEEIWEEMRSAHAGFLRYHLRAAGMKKSGVHWPLPGGRSSRHALSL